MTNLPRIDIESDNFNIFFAKQARELSEKQKELLPKPYLYKIYNKGGEPYADGHAKLSFLQKLFVLWKSKRHNIYIVIEDKDGKGVDDFIEFKEKQKKRDYSMGAAGNIIATENFFLCDKELSETFSYLNSICTSPSYRYLSGAKNKPTHVAIYKKHISYICKFLSSYEARQKRMSLETGLNMPEFMVLIYLYNAGEAKGSHLYNNVYRYSYHSSRTRFKESFGTLQSKGFIEKVGDTKGAMLKITALGSDKINEIMHKYIVNV